MKLPCLQDAFSCLLETCINNQNLGYSYKLYGVVLRLWRLLVWSTNKNTNGGFLYRCFVLLSGAGLTTPLALDSHQPCLPPRPLSQLHGAFPLALLLLYREYSKKPRQPQQAILADWSPLTYLLLAVGGSGPSYFILHCLLALNFKESKLVSPSPSIFNCACRANWN